MSINAADNARNVGLRTGQAAWDSCPRCLGRVGVQLPMYVSDQPVAVHANSHRLEAELY